MAGFTIDSDIAHARSACRVLCKRIAYPASRATPRAAQVGRAPTHGSRRAEVYARSDPVEDGRPPRQDRVA